jgi:peptidoglycan/xylan/chitin deacetylase (PgdA/CDA1 family)
MTKLIFSIDTEVDVHYPNFDPLFDTPDRQIYGRIGGKEVGICYMMNKFREYGCEATFFLTPYEAGLWQGRSLKGVAKDIIDRGFDCQLHTHVDEVSVRKKFIAEFSYEKQLEIISKGKQLLERWTNRPVTWHRGGHLSCNQDTIRALNQLGFVGDSSFCYGWGSCADLRIPVKQRNELKKLNQIWELPLTTFRTIPLIPNYRNVDINMCVLAELKKVVRQAVDNELPYLVVLLHSNSFVRPVNGEYVVLPKELERFNRFIEFIGKQKDIQHTNFSKLKINNEKTSEESVNVKDIYTGFFISYLRASQQLHRGKKNIIFVLFPIILLVISALIIFMMLNILV